MNYLLSALFRYFLPALFLSSSFLLTAQEQDCTAFAGHLVSSTGSSYIPVCIDDLDEDLTVIERTDFRGENSVYLMTTAAGFIVEKMASNPPYDFRSMGAGVRAIWSIAYSGTLLNAEIGDNICAASATGCFSLSNPVVLNRTTGDDCEEFCEITPGSISFAGDREETALCIQEGASIFPAVTVTQAATADNVHFLVATTAGEILSIHSDPAGIDLGGSLPGDRLIWQLAYADGLRGLAVGNTPEDFQGCFSLSNPLTVSRQGVSASTISIAAEFGGGRALTICAADGRSDAFEVDLVAGTGDQQQWVITNANGSIVLLPSGPPFDLETAGIGRCRIYHLTYANGLEGLRPRANIDDLRGCYALSDPIVVTRRSGANCPDVLVAEVSGSQLVPCPVTTTGRGTFRASLDGSVLTVTGSFEDLPSPLADHAGGGLQLRTGYAGQAGDFFMPLTPQLDEDGRGGLLLTADNQFGLSEEQALLFRQRGMYVTVHTEALPDGALRGQFLPERRAIKFGFLSGVNAVPSVSTDAFGGVVYEVAGNTLTVSGSFSGLSGRLLTESNDSIFLGLGAAGRAGVPLLALEVEAAPDGRSAIINPTDNSFTLSSGQLDSLRNNQLFLAVPTTFAAAGELRGQPTDLVLANFHAELSGQQVRPAPINTSGNGRISAGLSRDGQLTLSGSVDNLSGEVVSLALHRGIAGSDGPLLYDLVLAADPDGRGGVLRPTENSFALTAEQVTALQDRELYVKVSTSTHPAGEIRGQILHLATAYFGANLSGDNQAPGLVKSTGRGYVLFEQCGEQVTATGSFSDLSSNFNGAIAQGSQLQLAEAFSAGEVQFPLGTEVSPDRRSGSYVGAANTFVLRPEQKTALQQGRLYLNVRTLDHPEGEIRGQILRSQNAFPSAPTILFPREGGSLSISPEGQPERRTLYNPATDPDGDFIQHFVEFTTAQDTAFTASLARIPVDQRRETTTAIVAFHDSLRALGTQTGMAVDLCYRVVAGDGCVSTAGEPALFTLVFGNMTPRCDLEGGRLTLTDGSDSLAGCFGLLPATTLNVALAEARGAHRIYLLTDTSGTIVSLHTEAAISLPPDPPAGGYLIYGLTFGDGLSGVLPGLSVRDLAGCFALSTPVRVRDLTGTEDCAPPTCQLRGGRLSVSGDLTSMEICREDRNDARLTVELTGNSGRWLVYVLTDLEGNVIFQSLSPEFSLGNFIDGDYRIYALSFADDLQGLVRRGNLADLSGCYALSNPVTVAYRSGVECIPPCTAVGGRLLLPDALAAVDLCYGDADLDRVELSLTGAAGPNRLYVLTDTTGRILGLDPRSQIDLRALAVGAYQVYAVSFGNELTGALVGNQLTNLSGCFALSTPVTVNVYPADKCQPTSALEVAITELDYYGAVEMVNLSNAPFDFGTLYLGKQGDMRPLGSFRLGCGSLITQPGEIVTLLVGSLFERTGGELMLATSADPVFPVEALGYLKWGNVAVSPYAALAAEADVWIGDRSAASPTVTTSLQRMMDQSEPVYELMAPTTCVAEGATTPLIGPENAAADALMAYPNPFDRELMVKVRGLRGAYGELVLFDTMGKVVVRKHLSASDRRIRLRTGHLPAGGYWLRLTSGDKVSGLRVIR